MIVTFGNGKHKIMLSNFLQLCSNNTCFLIAMSLSWRNDRHIPTLPSASLWAWLHSCTIVFQRNWSNYFPQWFSCYYINNLSIISNIPLSKSTLPVSIDISLRILLFTAFLPLFPKDLQNNIQGKIYGMNKRFPDFVGVIEHCWGSDNVNVQGTDPLFLFSQIFYYLSKKTF